MDEIARLTGIDKVVLEAAITAAVHVVNCYGHDHLNFAGDRAAYEQQTHAGTRITSHLLNNEVDLFKTCRINTATFHALLQKLVDAGGLDSSRYLTAAERLVHFLYIVGHGVTYHSVHLVFKRSTSTVSESFHMVLKAILQLYDEYVKEPDYQQPVPERLRAAKYTEFRSVVGALDGTHIAARMPAAEAMAWRNRKGALTQNVLAVVDFNMLFTYVLAG
ncbi:unnamed protein product [Zymoseptoria tritici ST99CH_1A5]|uniref:DUF8040 domain-containing protein n=1 Tax=Zymoseptoria tritici ST99CH_1A5 TaxID=1276529 RepID=A0A1Y6LBN2_ZYMTR|nr:unnamed protein product [Zymoseptoria tritici ST99CH_1A5]